MASFFMAVGPWETCSADWCLRESIYAALNVQLIGDGVSPLSVFLDSYCIDGIDQLAAPVPLAFFPGPPTPGGFLMNYRANQLLTFKIRNASAHSVRCVFGLVRATL